MRRQGINLGNTRHGSGKGRTYRTTRAYQIAVFLAVCHKLLRRNIHYRKSVVDNGVKLLFKALFNHLGQIFAVGFMGGIPADIVQQLVRPLNYRGIVAVGHRDNIAVYHIGYLIRVIDYKFACALTEVIEIGKHFVGRFKVQRRLIVKIFKALPRHKYFTDYIIALFKKMHVPRGYNGLAQLIRQFNNLAVKAFYNLKIGNLFKAVGYNRSRFLILFIGV